MIWQLKQIFWTNEFSWDLSLRWVSDSYNTLQHPAGYIRADSRFAPSQWETSSQSNAISHWLGTNLESALLYCPVPGKHVCHIPCMAACHWLAGHQSKSCTWCTQLTLSTYRGYNDLKSWYIQLVKDWMMNDSIKIKSVQDGDRLLFDEVSTGKISKVPDYNKTKK